MLCDGDAIVHGTLSVAGDLAFVPPFTYPAGWVTTGQPLGDGVRCTSSLGGSYYWPPAGGSHAGHYGTVVPFSLEGGSPGGGLVQYFDQGSIPCGLYFGRSPGGPGGGTLALLAKGRIEVSGTITADGHHNSASGGSGGSILLRGETGVSVLPSGVVTARGGTYFNAPAGTYGSPGHIRIDAYGVAPVIQGSVVPVPTVVELPYLRQVVPPQIGASALFQVFAPETPATAVILSASLLPGPGTPTPFGILGIDLPTAASLGLAYVWPGHDPRATLMWPIPNTPSLVGLPLWIQGVAFALTLPLRLTNTVSVTVAL
ncbi:MAG: hypothetical protein Q7T30_02710 [Planctomycetota bacterium]|nr:hypothetical protein [Planctomycetota bacterium]